MLKNSSGTCNGSCWKD